MVQAVSRLLLTEGAWVRSKFSPRESSDGQNDTGAGFLQILRPCPVKIIPTTLHTHFHLHITLTRSKSGKLSKIKLLPKSGSTG